MSKIVSNVGRLIGGIIAGKAGAKARNASGDPLLGAAVGAATVYVAGKLLPRRLAGIGAAVAAGYVTRKLAQRAERLAQHGKHPRRAGPPQASPRKRVKARPAKP